MSGSRDGVRRWRSRSGPRSEAPEDAKPIRLAQTGRQSAPIPQFAAPMLKMVVRGLRGSSRLRVHRGFDGPPPHDPARSRDQTNRRPKTNWGLTVLVDPQTAVCSSRQSVRGTPSAPELGGLRPRSAGTQHLRHPRAGAPDGAGQLGPIEGLPRVEHGPEEGSTVRLGVGLTPRRSHLGQEPGGTEDTLPRPTACSAVHAGRSGDVEGDVERARRSSDSGGTRGTSTMVPDYCNADSQPSVTPAPPLPGPLHLQLSRVP